MLGPRLWNTLPVEITIIDELDAYKLQKSPLHFYNRSVQEVEANEVK